MHHIAPSGPSNMSRPPSKTPLLAPTAPKSFRASSSLSNMASSRLHPYTLVLPRHTSNPIERSPLQQSFPAYPNSNSAPNSPPMQETPSRRSRPSDQENRKRGESRSSSVPIAVRAPEEPAMQSESQPMARTRPHSRARSPFPRARGLDNSLNSNRRSVKHLTCFWWWEKGECRYSDEECLYSHYDTGHHTSAPRQVIPGEPAKAGKSLERALNKLAISNRSSVSLSSLANMAHGANTNHTSSSGPETPFYDRSRSSTPSPLEISQVAQLKADNDFLRTLIEQSQREKRSLIDAIDILKTEKTQLQSTVDSMSTERTNLLTEREVLQSTVKKLQFSTPFVPLRSPTSIPNHSPWGAIGSRRASPVESSMQRVISGGGLFGRIDPNGNGNGTMNGDSYINGRRNGISSSSLNPTALPYATAHDQHCEGFYSMDNGNESEKVKSVLRNLGPEL